MKLYDFVCKQNILYSTMLGFRTNHTTNMAALQFVDNLIQAIDNGNHSVGIFLDLSMAFDTLDHNILLCKLSHCDIGGIVLYCLKAYLSSRKQYVVFNGVNSNLRNISCGIRRVLFLVRFYSFYKQMI